MTYLNFTKHAASNDGNLRAQAQQIGWRESLAQWFTGGLPSLLLTLLLSWGLIVPTQAANILSPDPGTLSGSPVYPAERPDSNALDLPYSNFTLAACVNLAKYNVNYSATIYSKRGLQNGYFIGVDGNLSPYANGTVKFKVQGPNGPDVRSTPGVIVLGKTYDVVLVYKSGAAYIYINGSLNASFSIPAPVATDKPLRIGKDSQPLVDQGLPHVWNGTLSLLQIHDVALTEAEIQKHDAQCRSLSTLTVTKTGTGSGTVVSSNLAGISCGSDCTESYEVNTAVTLTATASPGSSFAGWSGGCTGTARTCQLTMSQIKTVTATFNLNPLLTVTKTGTGSGTVVSSNLAGINCGNDCTESYAPNTAVTLSATTSPGFIFTGWSGDCTGTVRTCRLTMSQIKTVTATFKPSVLLTVNVQEGGTVTGPSINCSDPCSVQMVRVVQGSSITLTATPLDGFRFTGWSGDCTGTSCTVSMTQIKAVTANFVPLNRSAVRSNSCGTPCQVDVAKDTKATFDPATGVLHLPAIEVLGQAGEIEVFQADLVWKTDTSKSWFELVSRQNSTALAGSPENAIYDLDTNTLMLPFVAVPGGDGTQFYTGELQLISADPQRFMVTLVREIEGSPIDSLPANR